MMNRYLPLLVFLVVLSLVMRLAFWLLPFLLVVGIGLYIYRLVAGAWASRRYTTYKRSSSSSGDWLHEEEVTEVIDLPESALRKE